MVYNNAANINPTGLVKADGSGGFSGETTTLHGIQIGAASNGLTSQVLTNGQLLIGSTGAAPVAATLTAGSGISVTNGSGTITIAATGGGFTSIVVQTFTSSGTYTPTSGMSHCIVEVVGGGGGSGGLAAPGTIAARLAISGSGGGGGYACKVFTSATIGASKTVTIGAGGTAGAAGNNAGGTGGTTEFGASPSILLQATGGAGGPGGASFTTANVVNHDAVKNGVGTLGDINLSGCSFASSLFAGVGGWVGQGGTSFYSRGTTDFINLTMGANVLNSAIAGTDYGGGARGAITRTASLQAAQAGAAGSAGIVIVTEFIT